MKPIKIAYCTPSLYIPGGVERVLTTKANYLADVMGYDVSIILTDGAGKEPFYPLSDKVKLVQLNIGFEELWHLPFLQKITLYLKKQRLYRKRLTDTLMQLRPDITVSLLRREINLLTSILDGSRKVGEMHVNRKHYRNFETDGSPAKKLFASLWQKQLLRNLKRLDRFVVLTEDDKLNWPELDNVEAIPNPLASFPEKCAPQTSKRAIAVGRYVYEKGFDLLIQAWKLVADRHPDWQLHIYGAGERESYEEKIRTERLEGAIVCHPATGDIHRHYADSAFYVCSSRFEGFGMVLAEAMSHGVPCVSFDCPCGPRNIIRHETDGLLVPNGETTQLANQIVRLIENPQERSEMGRKARENIARLKVENIMNEWDRLFKRLTIKYNSQ